MATADLRAELSTALRLTVRHLIYLAAIWRELESRGEDLSELRSGIGAYVASIAAGRVIPETVVAFADRPATLRRVAALPVAEQRAIASGAPVPQSQPRKVKKAKRAKAARVETGPQVPAFAAMARAGTPGDVVAMCMELVRASANPEEVATRLMRELQQMPRPKPKVLSAREQAELDKKFEAIRSGAA